MIKSIVMAAVLAAFSNLMAADSASSGSVYEMRTYYAPEGKLENLHARFRDHTMKLFEKHGIKNVGYFVPEGENPDHKLVYFLEFPSRDAAKQSWKDFSADADWQKAWKESEKDGKLVSKVESVYLQPTDYSPRLKIENKGPRVFELRTYTTPEGKLNDLNARFRDHTMKLFKKHGMENLAYWTKTADQKDPSTTLIYLLGHKSREAAKKSFDSFREDADWVTAKTASEKNGSLTVPNGVKSEFLVPTDYSPMK
ncbi:MAG TPA: NIPSNAP family protein [Verrucomicrobiae bacterium]|nr:NIPSNAP family protein [Verrucomicrobiae bacterium]